ncbi:AIPR family protein [Corticibacterium sp. UT-5YL-CI-8]|nr:AIPR family protein [Tianweitania sp. UT-5YL-CI-8]
MTVKPYRFEVTEARSFKHPYFPTIQKHTFLVRASLLPKGLPNKANTRDGNVGKNKSVYKDVRESLRGNEALAGSFDLLNMGITIIAEQIEPIDKKTFDVFIDDEFGIANGIHTASLIWECQEDNSIAEGQHVEVKIITGIEGSNEHMLRVDIARGQNASMAVKPQSIYELDGAFASIKANIVECGWADRVAYKESDPGDIDVRELIAAMELMNVVDYPNNSGRHPISAYEKWSSPLSKFGEDFKENRASSHKRVYHKLEPLLPDILFLYDVVRRDFLRIYKEVVSDKGALLKIVEKVSEKKEPFDFPFAGLDPHRARLTKGAAYPIVGAFRNYVRINSHTGVAEWVGGFSHVRKAWEEVGPILVKETREAIAEIGNSPNVLGKNRNHWSNMFKTVKLHLMEERLATMEGESI